MKAIQNKITFLKIRKLVFKGKKLKKRKYKANLLNYPLFNSTKIMKHVNVLQILATCIMLQ